MTIEIEKMQKKTTKFRKLRSYVDKKNKRQEDGRIRNGRCYHHHHYDHHPYTPLVNLLLVAAWLSRLAIDQRLQLTTKMTTMNVISKQTQNVDCYNIRDF